MSLSSKPSDEEVMLTIPENQLRRFLVAEKKSESEIERMVSELREKREKIDKTANKLFAKVQAKYPNKSESELLELSMRYANKHGLTSKAQQNALWRVLVKKLKGMRESPYLPVMKPHTEMARFLGVRDSNEPPLLDVPSEDKRYLEEIAALYEKYCGYGKLHDLVKANSQIVKNDNTYNQTNALKIPSTYVINPYNNLIDNKDVYINQIIYMIYSYTWTDMLEKQTLFASFARLILARSYNIMKSYVNMQYTSGYDLQVDNELVEAIAKDPSSTDFFSKQSPMSNLLQRTKCQIALWENVLKLRNGQVFGKQVEMNNPMGLLMMELERYPLTIFDDLNVYSFNNPVAILKKLLAVFSYKQVLFKYMDAGGVFPFLVPDKVNVLQTQFIQPSYAIQGTIHIAYLYDEMADVPAVPATTPPTTMRGLNPKNAINSLVNSQEMILDKKTPVLKNRKLYDAGDRIFVTLNLFNDSNILDIALNPSKNFTYKVMEPKENSIIIDDIVIGETTNKLTPISLIRYIKSDNMYHLLAKTYNVANANMYAPSLIKNTGDSAVFTNLPVGTIVKNLQENKNHIPYVSIIMYAQLK
jgi:hypothetical protein